jgi:SHS2 domain-containing protein
MSFRLRDHTADVAVEASGPDLNAVFAAVADGMTAAMCEAVPDTGDRFSFTVRAESREALLFDYLDELVYERDVREVLPTDHEVHVSRRESAGDEAGAGVDAGRPEWVADASARGVPLDDVSAREIKAVTYSEMRLEETDQGWEAYVVFDV